MNNIKNYDFAVLPTGMSKGVPSREHEMQWRDRAMPCGIPPESVKTSAVLKTSAEKTDAFFITCDDHLPRKCKQADLKNWFGTPDAASPKVASNS